VAYDIRRNTGKRVKVKHCPGAYQLPDGLPEGAEVTLVSFDHGYWTVRHDDRLFPVALACIANHFYAFPE
jgi:hypothetical protein